MNMAAKEPSYWVRWVMGIVAVLIGTILIGYYQSTKKPSKLVRFDVEGRMFSIEYPEILAPVQTYSQDMQYSFQVGTDFGFFQSMFGNSGLMYFWIQPVDLTYRDDRIKPPPDNNFPDEVNEEIELFGRTEQRGEHGQLPHTVIKFVKNDKLRLAYYNYWGEFAVVRGLGLFEESTWDRHEGPIRASFESIDVNEAAVQEYFKRNGWMTYNRYTTAEGREAIECAPSVWSPERLESAGCSMLDEYTNIGIQRYRCLSDRDTLLISLIRNQEFCDEFQARLDKRSGNP